MDTRKLDVVDTPEDIPSDQRLLNSDILIPFAGKRNQDDQ